MSAVQLVFLVLLAGLLYLLWQVMCGPDRKRRGRTQYRDGRYEHQSAHYGGGPYGGAGGAFYDGGGGSGSCSDGGGGGGCGGGN